MSLIFEKEKDPCNMLNSKFTSEIVTDDNLRCNKWITPYGVSFGDPYGGGDNVLYFYEYDKDLGGGKGCLSGNDIIKAIQQLEINPDKLRTKPGSIIKLEEITGQKAFRMENAFGKWHIRSANYSMFNNPFGCSLGYTRTEDEFEIYFFERDSEPRARVSVGTVIELLKSYGYIK